MYDSGDYAVQQIAAEFGVTRPTIYCPERARADFQDRLTEMRRRLERALDQRFTAEGRCHSWIYSGSDNRDLE